MVDYDIEQDTKANAQLSIHWNGLQSAENGHNNTSQTDAQKTDEILICIVLHILGSRDRVFGRRASDETSEITEENSVEWRGRIDANA